MNSCSSRKHEPCVRTASELKLVAKHPDQLRWRRSPLCLCKRHQFVSCGRVGKSRKTKFPVGFRYEHAGKPHKTKQFQGKQRNTKQVPFSGGFLGDSGFCQASWAGWSSQLGGHTKISQLGQLGKGSNWARLDQPGPLVNR
jgi:hypothetical protein